MMTRESDNQTGFEQPRLDPEPTECHSISGYRIAVVTTAAGLERHAVEWDRLAEGAPHRVHTISHAWIASFYEHFVPSGARSACILAFEGDTLVGVLPLVVSKKYSSFLAKVEVSPPANRQTFATDLVCREEDANGIIDAMIRGLDRFLPGAWELSFPHASERSQVVRRFRERSGRVLSFSEIDGYGNFVPIAGSFDRYLGSLRPEFVRNLRRLSRKAEGLPNYRVDFADRDDADGTRATRFFELEASGWKGRGGTAILCDPNEQAFYRAYTRRLEARGWLRWHEVHAEDKLIASHMAAKVGRVLYLWKIAYDESYRAFAPGNVLMLETIKRAFDLGDTDEVNCLTDSSWNRDWNMDRRAYLHVMVWPRRPLPFLAGYSRVKTKVLLRRVPFAKRCYHALRWRLSSPSTRKAGGRRVGRTVPPARARSSP